MAPASMPIVMRASRARRGEADDRRRSSHDQAGFTLVELMGVVVILGILAVVALGAYTKQVRSAHKSEVISDLSNLTLRQKTFLSVSGHYASSTDCEGDTCTYPLMADLTADATPRSWDINAAGYTAAGAGDTEYFRGGGDVHGFDALRFVPEGGDSWCGYATISGHGTNAADPDDADEPPTGVTLADAIYPDDTEPYYARDWFYGYALCDFDFDGTYWAFTTAHYRNDVNSTSIGAYVENE